MTRRFRVGLLATHPIQYYTPWYRALARLVDLEVFYCHRQSGVDQARSEFGVAFEWDVPLLDGYRSSFLTNQARRPNVSSFDGCNTPEINAIIHNNRFDAFIVIGWGVRSFWQAIVACWQTNTPLLVRGDSHLETPRSRLKQLVKEVAYRRFIPRFDAYLIVGERTRRYYRYYGADEARMFFAPHAVDNQYFSARSDALRPGRTELRAAWNLPADASVFLFAGKLVPRKRPLDFLLAIEAAARRHPNIYGLIVGDGELRAQLQILAVERGIPVRFAGFLNQSEMPRAYCAADALVICSDARETWGLVVNEAMACGIPAIGSDAIGCAPDLILPGHTGEQYPVANHIALARILADLASNNARLTAMGRRARRHIQRYSVELAATGATAAIYAVSTPPGRHNAA